MGDFTSTARLDHPRSGRAPLIILVHGAGPTDLDANVAGEDGEIRSHIFRDISRHLTTPGFAVPRYNKRYVTGPARTGLGHSLGPVRTPSDDRILPIGARPLRDLTGWSRHRSWAARSGRSTGVAGDLGVLLEYLRLITGAVTAALSAQDAERLPPVVIMRSREHFCHLVVPSGVVFRTERHVFRCVLSVTVTFS